MMSAAEVAVYERARKIWVDAGIAHRSDRLRPTFGANVNAIQTFGSRLAAWFWAFLKALR